MTQDHTEHTQNLKTSSSQNKYSFKLPLIIFAILVFNGLITIAYISLYVEKKIEPGELALKQFQQQLITLQSTFQHGQEELITSTISRLNHFDSTLNQKLKTLNDNASDWKLLKARYYLELASINNIWTNDAQTTLVLLKQADSLLHQIPDEKTTNVRQALADEEASILAAPKLDITGMLTTLHALQNAVDDLQQHQTPQSEKIPRMLQQPNSSTTWREHFQQTLQTLRTLVIIRHQDAPISTYLTPADIRIQREAVRLNLQEAQWAVIHHKASIYNLMLTQAASTVTRVFDPNDSKTLSFIKQVDQLKSINMSKSKPSLEAALNQLNHLIQASAEETSGDQP